MKVIPKDHDFIKTTEGFYFCVVGYVHPQDRIISYLKYVPEETGKWKDKDNFLKRVLRHYSASEVLNSFTRLKGNFEHYVYEDKVNDITFTAVPKNYISNYYKPQECVHNLMRMDPFDSLQQKAFNFIMYLSNISNIPIEDFGLTGSMLTNTHNPSFSDIDLTIHGHESAIKLENVVKQEYKDKKSIIKRPSQEEKDEWIQRKMVQYKLSKQQAELVLEKKWNFGYYGDIKFSIHPIKKDEEILEKYGAQKFEDAGSITVRARIIDDSEAIYLPCKYKIEDIEFIKGEKVQDLKEVVSFEGLYCFMARNGEKVEVKGKLEKVISSTETYHRIVIGSFKAKEQDYILALQEYI